MYGTKLFAAALVAVAATLAFATPGGAAGRDAFTGRWVGVEIPIGDGSTDYMVFSGPNAAGKRNFEYYETWATYCGGGALSASGSAVSVGGELTVTFTSTKCANGSPGNFPPPFDVTMDATGDGHIDWGGVIFSRAGTP